MLLGLGVNLSFLHLGDHASLREQLASGREISHPITPGRGNICDKAGQRNILALNLDVKDVCADPSIITRKNELERTAMQLAHSLGLQYSNVVGRLNRPERRFEYVSRFVRLDKAEEIRSMKLPGVYFNDAAVRYYPHESFMCHVIGFCNHEGIGSAGIEQSMDKYLRGCSGLIETEVDGRRRELYARRKRLILPRRGADVHLTLDQNIQYVVEKALDNLMAAQHPRAAWAIVERVRTGEILALASRPSYSLNQFRSSTDEERLNRTIGHVYEPGSALKPVVVAACLNEGLVTPNTVFDCENGGWSYEGRLLRDYHPHGDLTVADVIKKSSNIGAAKMAVKLGDRKFERYLRAFGFGGQMGVDLPGEERGLVHPYRQWSRISGTRIAMGQGIGVTALQMAGLFSAIANDGVLMKPYVVSRVVADDGSVLMEGRPRVIGHPISSETAAIMRTLLSRVVEEGGTGVRARLDGYMVAGKTGSSQKPVDGRYSDTAYVASFAGFLPADNPEIAIIVVADEPQPYHTGGVVAAPAFREIAEQAVRYLDILPATYGIANSPTRLSLRAD